MSVFQYMYLQVWAVLGFTWHVQGCELSYIDERSVCVFVREWVCVANLDSHVMKVKKLYFLLSLCKSFFFSCSLVNLYKLSNDLLSTISPLLSKCKRFISLILFDFVSLYFLTIYS